RAVKVIERLGSVIKCAPAAFDEAAEIGRGERLGDSRVPLSFALAQILAAGARNIDDLASTQHACTFAWSEHDDLHGLPPSFMTTASLDRDSPSVSPARTRYSGATGGLPRRGNRCGRGSRTDCPRSPDRRASSGGHRRIP